MIVGSILLAFGIDAWWDGQQTDARRVDLLHGLEADFTETRDLVEEQLACATDLRDRAEAFLEAAGDRLALSPDSIAHLSVGIVTGICVLSPSLTSYSAALASGEISLVESEGLRSAFATFDRYRDANEELSDLLLESFYSGPLNDLRRELGSLSVLNADGGRREAPSRFVPSDLNEVIQNRAVYAAAEPTYVLRWNTVAVLEQLLDATDQVVEEVRRLLGGDAGAF